MSVSGKTFIACASLLMLFAVISWSATSSKGATYDEPYHALSAWLQLHRHDYRMDNEDPPLWLYWASLPNGKSALKADFEAESWKTIPQNVAHQWYWGVVTLYRTPGNDPATLIHRCRMMMLLVSIALGACIARWSWQIAGGLSAVIATFCFALDPNFMAHGALMKNDVVFSLSMLLLSRELWLVGKSLSAWGAARLMLLCVLALSVKFSGVVTIALVPMLLITRALLADDWPVPGHVLRSRFKRGLTAVGLSLCCGIISILGIWAVYGFRFAPTPDPAISLNVDELAQRATENQIAAGDRASGDTGASPAVHAALFANSHHLLPQAYLAGFLFTYANAQAHPAFAAGEISMVGWWWYFPYAMLVKTPLVTMLAGVATAWIILQHRRLGWTAICLGMPVAVFLASAMHSHFNIGLRHILPIYPLGFVAIGWGSSRLWRCRRGLVCAMGVLLAIESLSAYPNFIPFFNIAATQLGGGKLNLLGDSNLDWGQDLPLLADWQRANPNIPLYLSYFGYEDPAYYHIRYTPLPGGYHYDPPPKFPQPMERCVLAISATNLQGVLEPPPLRDYYAQCQKLKLIDVLGGTIYLFEYDPTRLVGGGLHAIIDDRKAFMR
jgi:hypothetical protein